MVTIQICAEAEVRKAEQAKAEPTADHVEEDGLNASSKEASSATRNHNGSSYFTRISRYLRWAVSRKKSGRVR